ncbi:hypothetical protein QM797_05700 [Rhodococcus sp. IEGM 1381]|uniref:hypothetical protein n=1 Tax=Rhodococcus sp. IEGM 1381 TaxID=3047085 RepID=UPI0024B6F618|nr:hypothetical protein [Rhodococcus sp. IEGM 1381]MDI9894214.1 hypothetical protein [Rhodococcus sp. IEGM 1381]
MDDRVLGKQLLVGLVIQPRMRFEIGALFADSNDHFGIDTVRCQPPLFDERTLQTSGAQSTQDGVYPATASGWQ